MLSDHWCASSSVKPTILAAIMNSYCLRFLTSHCKTYCYAELSMFAGFSLEDSTTCLSYVMSYAFQHSYLNKSSTAWMADLALNLLKCYYYGEAICLSNHCFKRCSWWSFGCQQVDRLYHPEYSLTIWTCSHLDSHVFYCPSNANSTSSYCSSLSFSANLSLYSLMF